MSCFVDLISGYYLLVMLKASVLMSGWTASETILTKALRHHTFYLTKKQKAVSPENCWCTELVYGDFIEKQKLIGINWGMQSNKVGLA